jgi:hypothetical protein
MRASSPPDGAEDDRYVASLAGWTSRDAANRLMPQSAAGA